MLEERVSENFDPKKLRAAQEKAWRLLYDLAAHIRPGMIEADAQKVYFELAAKAGAEKYWHPPKIRFGINTMCAFREPSVPDTILKVGDPFFLDIGPIFDGYEGDVGRTFLAATEGTSPLIDTCKSIFDAVVERFRAQGDSGAGLYAFAERLAKEAGYELVGEGAKGHRISDFPHAVYYRGNLKGFERRPAPDRWILEIQVRDRGNQIGAFFEDILD